ncbi:hypothetical protein Gogos_009691 [Gossypium gossypioides]|uniref:F-box domain-containing protein n=1 Tax=Gossypium gossypioides TaxID=34282 RepID=A0A7J9BIW5_GOSGO|nr:hypothetical protein [Gossypium gossypioides]
MATLSHDLTIEILRGLSVKDLLRSNAFQSHGALRSRTHISSSSTSPIPSKPIPITLLSSVTGSTTSSPSTATHSKQPKYSTTHSMRLFFLT